MDDNHYNIYAVKLDPKVLSHKKVQGVAGHPDKPAVYVGMSGLAPEVRFQKHKDGLKGNKFVQRYGESLVPELYRELQNLPYDTAVEKEQWLAKKLKSEGYTVLGGLPPAVKKADMVDDVDLPLKAQQERVVKRIQDPNTPGLVLYHGTGSGKALQVGTNVLTDHGWTQIQNLKIGDQVFSVDGSLTAVTGVYPQGLRDIYSVTFRDGATINCDGEHLWHTQTAANRKNVVRLKTTHGQERHLGSAKTTLQIKESLRQGGKWNHTIPLPEALQFSKKELPLDPYVLGLLLGDGCIKFDGAYISTGDSEIIQSIKDAYPSHALKRRSNGFDYHISKSVTSYKNEIVTALKSLKLLGTGSLTKFIPDCYLFNNVETRLAILQGLMDTDGFVSKDGYTVMFESISEKLKDGVKFLVESLGGNVTVKSRIPTFTYKGEKKKGQLCYRVYLFLPPKVMPFRLTRKKNRVVPKTSYKPARYITGVTLYGKDHAVCITVAHPSKLFITEHCLVTHNSLAGIGALNKLNMPTNIIVPSSLQDNYRKELNKWLGSVPSKVNIVSQQRLARPDLQTKILPNGLDIIDEAAKAKNFQSSLYNQLSQMQPRKRLLLSATPSANGPYELAAQVNLAAGKNVLPADKTEFMKQYVQPREVQPPFWQRMFGVQPGTVYDLKNRDQLKGILDKYVDYYPSNHEGFPNVKEQLVRVPMGPNQMNIYNTVMKNAPWWTRMKVKSGLPPNRKEIDSMRAFLGGARQISNTTQGFTTRPGELEDPKIQSAFQYLQNQVQKDPTYKGVVYSNYIGSGLNPYKQLLDKSKIPYGEFSGQVAPSAREQMVRDYNANKLKALLISDSGAEGLDLKGTRLTQILNPSWNIAKEKQVEGRGARYLSHAALPPDKQNMLVQRYLATPKASFMDRILGYGRVNGVDEYIHNMALEKDRLNNEVVKLLTPEEQQKKKFMGMF